MAKVEGMGEPVPDLIQRQVHGYAGYSVQGQRRETDELLRAHLTRRLEQLAAKLGGAVAHAQNLGAEQLSEPLARLQRKVCTICGGLQAPAYLHSLFFDRDPLPAQMLQSLYESELALLREVGTLDEELADLEVASLSQADLEERALRMGDAVDAFNQALFERESLLLGDMAD